MSFWQDKTVLVTGGTGSFGSAFARHALDVLGPRRVVIFSRDELKQHQLRTGGLDEPRLRYFIGDVRDLQRLRRAFKGVDVVIHAAALKQVPACEYNPIEAVNTNINGSRNVIEAALDCDVARVLMLSTDKAANPVNLYGGTKMVAEKLFVQANAYSGAGQTRFACVRYGNVVGSRGSVIPLFLGQRRSGRVTVTDSRMTRFWITLDAAVGFVADCVERMTGGEIFVPKLPSANIMDLVEALAPECEVEVVGIRPGEKVHETLIGENEARQAVELDDRYVVRPLHPWWSTAHYPDGRDLPEGFSYASDKNPHVLRTSEIRRLLGTLAIAAE
ncbi:MAG: UDP-N-acetylglucosamine 4,6-dehydratase (inverting) [Pseudomonadota bacterium]